MNFPAESLERLAQRVHEGDVVFFIGSGFSSDTEGNSISRMLLRLLARLHALAQAMNANSLKGDQYLDDLDLTFGLERTAPTKNAPIKSAGFWKLADKYFETNEWFCNTFGLMLAAATSSTLRQTLIDETARLELELLKMPANLVAINADEKNMPADIVPPKPIGNELFDLAAGTQNFTPRMAGKALFLDTLGFRQQQVMGGEPTHPDLRKVATSYMNRLLPRHHVLARLAREGLCNTTLTTNFDLLIEGAFRLAGFHYRESNKTTDTLGTEHLPRTSFFNFARLSSPTQFFTDGKAHRTAVIVKMHGCAETYRASGYSFKLGQPRTPELSRLHDYLPSLVFTYREIQNWRTDSWAADYVRTLLRTRVVVFCGYSLADPVIHDTFRTVYEEMERIRRQRDSEPTSAKAEKAPAFFFAYNAAKSRAFYAQEVLRAASRAVNAPDDGNSTHPNTIGFFGRGGEFPNLDETFQWLFHRTFRLLQEDSLKSDLRRIATLLLDHPAPECEIKKVQDAFGKVLEWEKNRAGQPTFDADVHGSITAWTEHFHTGLLREFAAVDTLHRRQGPGLELAFLRRHPWYYPAMQDTSWTAWGAVVELAIRNYTANQLKLGSSPGDIEGWLKPVTSRAPTFFYHPATGTAKGAPRAVTILFGSFRRNGEIPEIPGLPAGHLTWELHAGDAPWRRANDKAVAPAAPQRKVRRQHMRAPDADWIWRWAASLPDADTSKHYLQP